MTSVVVTNATSLTGWSVTGVLELVYVGCHRLGIYAICSREKVPGGNVTS